MFEPHDTLVKTLAVVFLNPADKDFTGKKIFIQKFLGCGCPDDIVEQATVRFFCRPLGVFLDTGIDQAGATRNISPIEQKVNAVLELPENLPWPRTSKGTIAPPARWHRSTIANAAANKKDEQSLTRLKAMAMVDLDAVIEVPGRAFFFLVVEGRKKLKKETLLLQYESGQLLYRLMGYNRCRLFTITMQEGPKRIEQIDTALTWDGLQNAFEAAKNQYPFSTDILGLFDSLKTGGAAWKKATNSPFGMC